VIRLPPSIYMASTPVNLRLSFDRLGGIVRDVLGHEPRTEAAFVFHNKARTHVKILWHDGRGYCVLYNPLSSHYTSFRFETRTLVWLEVLIAAARSESRSQRLQCFSGCVSGSS